jgi:hypothetical protein
VKAVQTWTNNELEDHEICKNSATTFFSSKTRAKNKTKKLHNVSAVVWQQQTRRRRNLQLFSSQKKIYKNEFERFLFLCACANVLPASKTSAAKMLVYIQKILAYRPFWAHDIPDQCRPW